MSKDVDFYHSQDIYQTNMGKTYWILLQKWGLDAAKTASKKVFHKIAEPTGELIGNKIAEWIQEIIKKLLFHQRKGKKY